MDSRDAVRAEHSRTAAKQAKSWLGALTAYHGRDDLLVLGLARGGVPVGWEVAASLRAPLDVFLVRKLGVPSGKSLRWAPWPAAAGWWSTTT